VHEAGTIGIGEDLTGVENHKREFACSATLALRDIEEVRQNIENSFIHLVVAFWSMKRLIVAIVSAAAGFGV
jgi:hypothetical protein